MKAVAKMEMKKICAGMIAHVDSGKTTLSESLLYISGTIRKLGRVDNGDAFLDTFSLEKARGITIFSKQAQLQIGNISVALLDTPGHVDFSAEMERTLQVLDVAVLVISGADGVQGHTETLWKLLHKYNIPTYIFINKMDQPGTDREPLMEELAAKLGEGCIDFTRACSEEGMSSQEENDFYESIAVCDEELLESFLEAGADAFSNQGIGVADIVKLIADRKVFPCFFGSALKGEGVDTFMRGFETYMITPAVKEAFGGKVFKIARDEQGNRLTYMKITGGSLHVRDTLQGVSADGEAWEEKVTQIRIYSGAKYDTVNDVEAGSICALLGLTKTFPGEGIGEEEASGQPLLEPVLTYAVLLPPGCDANTMLPKLKQLEEEEPQLHIVWDEELKELQVQLMGEVQIEILRSMIWDRFHVEVNFGTGNIVYKETIAAPVEGIGHFEPLRHYAEVHLLLEPGDRGSGMQFASNCSEDILDKNWQRLIMTHLEEKNHKGVLTGSYITDMKITLLTGRAHQKHTEGGDFRQATYRAVRQGLMQAKSVLLEPYYEFQMEVPTEMVGRAMTDLEKMNGVFELPELVGEKYVLKGTVPVSTMRDYQKEVISYTKGRGRVNCSLHGYGPCHNSEEVIADRGYVPERDLYHTPDSVFCAHGAGYVVSWDEVRNHSHVDSGLQWDPETGELLNRATPKDMDTELFEQMSLRAATEAKRRTADAGSQEVWIGTEEVDAILHQTYHSNKRGSELDRKRIPPRKVTSIQPTQMHHVRNTINQSKEEYLLVDGYNIIFAWDELKELAAANIDGARGKLLDILSNYQGIRRVHVIVVFDAYRVQGHQTEMITYHNIHVVYTKHAETADQYIEKFASEHGRHFSITVATSDGLEQIIITSQGCRLLSARELAGEIAEANASFRKDYLENQPIQKKHRFSDALSEEAAEQMKRFQEEQEQ